MRVIAKKILREFWEKHPDSKFWLQDWYAEVHGCKWESPDDVKQRYKSASILKGNRVVFNVCGNKYRLVVKINYPYSIVYVRFIGKHSDYDKINSETV